MPATLPMPTRRRTVSCCFMLSMKGVKVATVALTLVARMVSNTCWSSGCSVRVPCETPALAMTMSAPPQRAMKSCAAAARAAWSVTSSAYTACLCGSGRDATSCASTSPRRATSPSVAPWDAYWRASASPRPLEAPVMKTRVIALAPACLLLFRFCFGHQEVHHGQAVLLLLFGGQHDAGRRRHFRWRGVEAAVDADRRPQVDAEGGDRGLGRAHARRHAERIPGGDEFGAIHAGLGDPVEHRLVAHQAHVFFVQGGE